MSEIEADRGICSNSVVGFLNDRLRQLPGGLQAVILGNDTEGGELTCLRRRLKSAAQGRRECQLRNVVNAVARAECRTATISVLAVGETEALLFPTHRRSAVNAVARAECRMATISVLDVADRDGFGDSQPISFMRASAAGGRAGGTGR